MQEMNMNEIIEYPLKRIMNYALIIEKCHSAKKRKFVPKGIGKNNLSNCFKRI